MLQISTHQSRSFYKYRPAQITTILDELNKYHQELEMIHHSNEYNIDITAQNINKYTALQYIFDADVKYIAFGNDHNDIVMLQHASSGYIIGPSEAYTHAILKLDKIKHINNNTQAICKVLKSYNKAPYQMIIIINR